MTPEGQFGSLRILSISIITTNQFILYRKIMAICSENYTRYTIEILNIKHVHT